MACETEGNERHFKKPFTKTVLEYSSASTIHGISYIFETGRLIFERIFWGLVVVIAIILALTWSITAYKNWQNDPVLTTIATTGLPIENVPFPSITICAQGILITTSTPNQVSLPVDPSMRPDNTQLFG